MIDGLDGNDSTSGNIQYIKSEPTLDYLKFKNDEGFELQEPATNYLSQEIHESNSLNVEDNQYDSNKIDDDKTSITPSAGDSRKMRKILKKAQIKSNFEEDVRQFFNMKCERCPQTFQTIEDAIAHYPEAHGIDNGYVKCSSTQCSQAKFQKRCNLREHIDFHKNPDKFK